MFCSSAILILRVSSVAVGHPRISQRQPREGVFLANLHVRAPVVESGVIAPQRIHLYMEFPQHVLAKKPHSAWPPPDSDWREASTLLTISACCILRSQVGSCAHPPLDCREQILQILDCRRAYSLSHISHPPWLLTSTLCDLFPGTSLCTHPSPACTYITASFPPTWLCAHPTQSNAIHQNGACGVFVAISFWRKAPTLEGRLTKSQYVLRGGGDVKHFTLLSSEGEQPSSFRNSPKLTRFLEFPPNQADISNKDDWETLRPVKLLE